MKNVETNQPQLKKQVVIVSGMSGAGKTHAADWFEDHGFYCIDNMPPALIRNFLDLLPQGQDRVTKAAFVVDIRSDEFFAGLSETIDYLSKREDLVFSILFMEASNSTLIRRYNESRRSHPLSTGKISQKVIDQEREMLAGLKKQADYVLDTTNLKVSAFNRAMEHIFVEDNPGNGNFAINVMSFGFKYGIPAEMDMIFDMRFIPNPYYVESLKTLTGNNKKVQHYVLKQEVTQQFVAQLRTMIETLVPCYVKEGKNHLNIAFGCTGGQHRSVTLANEMSRIFREEGYRVTLEHREL